MEKVDIQKQQGTGLALITRKDGDDSWKVVKQRVYLLRHDRDDRFEEKQFYTE
jgi:hypothetical protein